MHELTSPSSVQVEFYLSDANLPTDKKLLKLVRKDKDGFGKKSVVIMMSLIENLCLLEDPTHQIAPKTTTLCMQFL
jgi:hypothetical protein